MTGDGANSNLAKWNLIGGMQFKNVKLPNVHVRGMIWYVLIGLWT